MRLLSTTLGQILAIIACSTLATSLLFIALAFLQNTSPGPPWPWAVTHRIVSLVDLLEGVPEQYRRRASLLASAQQPNLSVTMRETAMACDAHSLDALVLESALKTELRRFPGLAVGSCGSGDPATDVQVIVPIGRQVLEIRTGNLRPSPIKFDSPAFGALLFMLVSIVALSIWAVWRVIRPLRRLSEKADAFGRDISPAPIEAEGPAEIQRLARAFNLMQERISRSLHERTRMLAAINHDLRTPLTRMRLQIETARQDVDLDKLTRNIDLMQKMLASALAFLRSGADDEQREWIDLDALLSTLCDEYAESGAAIRYEGPGHIRFHCRPNAIQRALSNLIENALHFGRSTRVGASFEGGSILIEIADDGPGIPPEHLQDVLKPFFRLDASRNDRPGSVGLGLSIVQEIVQVHGGTLALVNRQPRGLAARIAFPCAAGRSGARPRHSLN